MLSSSIFNKTPATLLLTLVLSSVFSVANAEKERNSPPNRKPPPEAFSACSDLSEGSACRFSKPDGKAVDGICIVPRKSEESFFCKPSKDKGR